MLTNHQIKDINFYKTIIKSLVIPYQDGVSVRQLFKEFEELEGHPFPYARLGYFSHVEFLRDSTDIVQIKINDPFDNEDDYIVFAISNQKTRHIEKAVEEQRPDKHKNQIYKQRVVHNLNFGRILPNLITYSNSNSNSNNYSGKSFSLDSRDNEAQEDVILDSNPFHSNKSTIEKRTPVCGRPQFRRYYPQEKHNVQLLLSEFNQGVLLVNFLPLYKYKFKTDLNFFIHGFKTLKEFLLDMKDSVKIIKNHNTQNVVISVKCK